MPPARLFISYRRDDSAGYARALHEALAQAFGHERVFIDVDDIAAGQRFADVIRQALDTSAVLLVLIGPRWTGTREGAPARIHDDEDFVRREVEAGLTQGLHLVPVLLDGTPLPAPAELPPSLHPLLQHHALALGSQGFRADLAQLLTVLRPLLGVADTGAGTDTAVQSATPRAARRRTWGLGAAALLLAAVGAGTWWWDHRGPQLSAWAGAWDAEVTYPWSNAVYTERISLRVEAATLAGSASFLRVPRVVDQVRFQDGQLHFVTRSVSGDGVRRWEELHRYRLQPSGPDRLDVQMQTESDGLLRAPLQFTAQRRPGSAAGSGP